MQEQTCQDGTLEMTLSARDKATEAYSGVVSTPRNEPDAFKRQCFRDGWDAAIAAMPDTKALEAADRLADVMDNPIQSNGKLGQYMYPWSVVDVALTKYRAARWEKS